MTARNAAPEARPVGEEREVQYPADDLLDAARAAALAEGRSVLHGPNVPPLQVWKRFGLRLATSLADPVHPYPFALSGIEVSPASVARTVRSAEEAGSDILRLRHIFQFEEPVSVLPQGAQAVRHETSIAQTDRLPAMTVARTIRRRTRWVQLRREYGDLDFVSLDEAADRLRAVERMIGWKRHWFAEQGIKGAGFDDAVHLGTLRRLARDPGTEALRVNALVCAGREVAIETSIAQGSTLLNTIIAVDPAFRQYGVGVLLSKLALQDARERGFAAVDFLPLASAHKDAMTHRRETRIELRVPLTVKGRLALWAFARLSRRRERRAARRAAVA